MAAKKKYQIFISSTFIDMKDERQAAVEAILTAGHIPAGMELFAAGDEEQLAVIKRWIDESDIYVLLLGARYGSIDPKAKLSYTELEYNYAIDTNKPLCALVLSHEALKKKGGASPPFVETGAPAYLEAFRQKVLTKMSKLVDDCKDIKIHLPEAIRNLESRHQLMGWIRSDDAPDAGALNSLVNDLSAIREENLQLETKLAEAIAAIPATPSSGAPLADLSDALQVVMHYQPPSRGAQVRYVVRTTWGELFAALGPSLLSNPTTGRVQTLLAEILLDQAAVLYARKSAEVERVSFETIQIQLQALGLVDVRWLPSTSGTPYLYWQLTNTGRTELIELRAVRKE